MGLRARAERRSGLRLSLRRGERAWVRVSALWLPFWARLGEERLPATRLSRWGLRLPLLLLPLPLLLPSLLLPLLRLRLR